MAAGDYANWSQIAAGDVTGDGLADLVMIGPAGYRVYPSVAANNSSVNVPGTFAQTPTTSALAVDTIFTDLSLAVTPSVVNFMFDKNTPSNSGPLSADVQVSKPGAPVQWTASVPGGNPSWLASPTSPTTGSTGGKFTVTVSPGKLSVGAYQTVVNVHTNVPPDRTVTVNLKVVNHVNKTDLPFLAK